MNGVCSDTGRPDQGGHSRAGSQVSSLDLLRTLTSKQIKSTFCSAGGTGSLHGKQERAGRMRGSGHRNRCGHPPQGRNDREIRNRPGGIMQHIEATV